MLYAVRSKRINSGVGPKNDSLRRRNLSNVCFTIEKEQGMKQKIICVSIFGGILSPAPTGGAPKPEYFGFYALDGSTAVS